MKRGILLAVLAVLLTFGFFLSSRHETGGGQTATIVFDNTTITTGDNDETQETITIALGARMSDERLLFPDTDNAAR